MGMQNFSSEFKTPEQYIIDITYKIWEERGVGRIRDWYAPICPVRRPHGVTNTVEEVVNNTLRALATPTLHREVMAEDVIIGDKPSGFYSSHRVRSVNTRLNRETMTTQLVMRLGIADCLCRDNQVVEEWVLGDEAGVLRRLGLDPVAHGRELGTKKPEAYTIGNEAMRQRWVDANGLTIEGDQTIANRVIETCSAMWNDKNLNVMSERYDRAVRLEGPDGYLGYGRSRTADLFSGIQASIPDGRYQPHHVIVCQEPERPVRVALRWTYCGSHSGNGRYGEQTGVPVALLGISHFELRDGLVVNEWLVVDETAVYAQIAAYQLAG